MNHPSGWPSFLRREGWALGRCGIADRFEERMRERERIARELHDTLLQGTQALLLAVHALAAGIRPDDPMRRMLTDTLTRADALMAQGRDRIQNLRDAGDDGAVDLAQSLANAWRDLGGQNKFSILVEGPSRGLLPDAGDEIALIAREALSNALRHASASSIEAQIIFGDDSLRLRVRDDGVGFGGRASAADLPTGHWGLLGMKERAQRIGSRLTLWSSPGAGTEVDLMVPARFAYGARATKRRWSAGLFAGPQLFEHSTDPSRGR